MKVYANSGSKTKKATAKKQSIGSKVKSAINRLRGGRTAGKGRGQ